MTVGIFEVGTTVMNIEPNFMKELMPTSGMTVLTASHVKWASSHAPVEFSMPIIVRI